MKSKKLHLITFLSTQNQTYMPCMFSLHSPVRPQKILSSSRGHKTEIVITKLKARYQLMVHKLKGEFTCSTTHFICKVSIELKEQHGTITYFPCLLFYFLILSHHSTNTYSYVLRTLLPITILTQFHRMYYKS